MRFFTAVLAATFALSSTPEGLGTAQLLPFGEFAARDGRPGKGKTWKISDTQGEALSATLNAIASRTPIVIDYEHHTLTAQSHGHLAIASGWIKSTEWRKGEGLFATVEWTAAAKGRIESKEYQYISPVITYDEAGNVTGLALAALVNYPAIVGMDPAMAAALSAFSAHLNTEQESTVTLLAALIAGLGLKPETTEAEAIVAVAALKAQVAAPPAVPVALATALKLQAGADLTAACSAITALQATDATATSTIAALQGEIVALKAKGAGDEVETLVSAALTEGKLLPAQKDWALNMGRQNVASLKAFIAATPVLAASTPQAEGDPGKAGKAALSAEQSEVFAMFGISQEVAAKHLAATKPAA